MASPKKEICSFVGQNLKLDTAADALPVVAQMESLSSIQSLHFSGNTVGVEAAETISEHLESRPELEEAHFSDMFTGRLKTEIPLVLRSMFGAIQACGASLTLLDLSDNAFGPIGVEGIRDFLKSPSAYSLRVLKLNNNGLGIGGGKMLSDALLECIKESEAAGKKLAIEVFICGRNRLENEGAAALSRVFAKLGSLRHLEMPQNGINPPGIEALATALVHNTHMQILNLSDNTFTSRGGKKMAETLVSLRDLEIINFDDCLIRSSAFKHILDAIKNHPELKVAANVLIPCIFI